MEIIDNTKDIVIAVSTSNKNGSGQHVMMLYRDKINPTKNRMVDINGSYGYGKQGRSQATNCLEVSKLLPLVSVWRLFSPDANKRGNFYPIYTLQVKII